MAAWASPDGAVEVPGDGDGYRRTAFRIVGFQALLTLAAAGAMLGLVGPRAAWSALVGGGICVLSGAYLAAKMFRFTPGTPPARMVRAFYVGEAVKIVLTAGLFTLAFVWLDVDVLVLIATYAATLVVYWLALLGTAGRQA